MGGAPGINVGIGTSFLCLIAGHAFWQKVPAWVLDWGCSKCAGQGKLPVRPEGGGRLSATTCDRCGGSGIDPDKKDEVPADWGQKKRRRRHQDPTDATAKSTAGPGTFVEMLDAEGESNGWSDWLNDVKHSDHQVLCAKGEGWGSGPNTEKPDPKPGQRVRIARPSCRRCGAPNPGFTEPPREVGIFGRILRWLF